jgi:hypothetical protein
MLRIIFAFLGLSGIVLLLSGLVIVDGALDMYTMSIGFAMSMIGVLSFAVFAYSTWSYTGHEKTIP